LSRFDFPKYRIEVLLSSIFLIAAAFLNLQFLSGANLNTAIAGHDEYLTVKDVYSILAPLSFKHFILALLHGSFLAYGSMMFYVDALFAFIPFKLFGLEGMVYSIRMTHALFLVLGISLLSHTFLRSSLSKMLFILSSFLVAHTFYFTMMPKPEPMQLFFFALFLYYFKKNNWGFGRHFFWLGVAFGLKITILIFLPFIFIVPTIVNGRIQIESKVKEALWASASFLLGFFLAVPYILLALVRPSYLNSFIAANLGNTTKVYDDSSITLMDWLNTGLGEAYLNFAVIGYLFTGLLLLLIVYLVLLFLKEKQFRGESLIGFFALIFIVFIGLKVDRLWPHYLWMAYVLAVLAFNELQSNTSSKTLKKGLLVFNILILGCVGTRFTSHSFTKYFKTESEPEVIRRMADSQILFRYIDDSYNQGIRVGTDGTVLYTYEQFVKANVYHPFEESLPTQEENTYHWYFNNSGQIWDNENDLVIFGDRHPLRDSVAIRKQYPHWNVDQHAEVFKLKMKSEFELDTIIGELEVYKRNGLR
jgi:hypothetical protein